MTPHQRVVYDLLKKIGPTTDADIYVTLKEDGHEITESGARHRRNALVKQGKVTKTRAVVKKIGTNGLIVWKAK